MPVNQDFWFVSLLFAFSSLTAPAPDDHELELVITAARRCNLMWIDFSVNHITRIPESIGNLINLQSLNLNSMNATFDVCVQLCSQSITDNRITSIPESIGNLANLQWFSLNSMNAIFDVCICICILNVYR